MSIIFFREIYTYFGDISQQGYIEYEKIENTGKKILIYDYYIRTYLKSKETIKYPLIDVTSNDLIALLVLYIILIIPHNEFSKLPTYII